MSGLNLLDSYTMRARFFPALLAGAPAIALAAMLVSWNSIGLPHLIATAALGVLLFVLSDVARRRGKAIEPELIQKMGGLPSTVMQRFSDKTFDTATKVRDHQFLGAKIGAKPPTQANEQNDPAAADTFYVRCGNWLRENTRDTKKFKILFDENVTYGFRRNLLGLKWPAFFLNILIVVACVILLWYRGSLDLAESVTQKFLSVLVIAFLHALYLALFVTEAGVFEAARQYARQLLLSCAVLREPN